MQERSRRRVVRFRLCRACSYSQRSGEGRGLLMHGTKFVDEIHCIVHGFMHRFLNDLEARIEAVAILSANHKVSTLSSYREDS